MDDRSEGTRRIYQIDPKGLGAMRALARPVLGFGAHRFRRGSRTRCQRGEEMSTQIRPQITPAPVRKSIFVNAPQDRAFDVFTAASAAGGPRRTRSVRRISTVRSSSRGKAGAGTSSMSTAPSARSAGSPPGSRRARLVLIWQLTPEFTYDPDLITEVEVQFTPEAAGTRVDLEHRDLERVGEKADAMRETVSGPGGWPALLQLFADEAQSQAKRRRSHDWNHRLRNSRKPLPPQRRNRAEGERRSIIC